MNTIIIDTCTLIWIANGEKKLSAQAIELLESEDAEVFLSAISAAEIACLAEEKRIRIKSHWKKWLEELTRKNSIQILPIDFEIICEAFSLPGEFHKDPADRLIVASARKLNATVITNDKKIINYPFVKSLG